MNRNKGNKGITLIALVVTVVVLLILAGITISLMFGEDSIFETANKSKIDTIHAKVYDTIGTMSQDYYIKSQAGLSTSSTLLDYLKSKQIIDENNVVNTEKLFGKKETLGNGTLDTGDVYVIEKEEPSDKTKYKLVYYEKNNETNKNLGYLPGDATKGDGGSEEDESRDWAKYFTYDLNEETKTATVTGVKEDYQIIGYYDENKITSYVYGMKDGDTVITDIVIPSHVQEKDSSGTEISYTVVEIVDGCFYRDGGTKIDESKSFKSFRLPDTIERIGDRAFKNCNELTSVNVGNSVTSIGNSAFDSCSGLTSITVDSANTTYDSRNNCNAIIERNTNSLILGCKNTIIPDDVTSIGERAFYGCSGLTSINIPNSVTSIGNSAFDGCSGLTSITVDSANTTYDSRNNCNAIIERNTNSLILGCKNTIIPDDVTSIGERAFYGCSGLTSINIPNSVTSIGNSAFYNCGLTSINIPISVDRIGSEAFANCFGLTTINCQASSEPFMWYHWKEGCSATVYWGVSM